MGGENYIITANEGDAQEYDTFDKETRVSKLDLDPTAFPNGNDLQDKKVLGNLKVTTEMGDIDTSLAADVSNVRWYQFSGR
ncbi:MAG: hypothetical protein U9Q89_07520 [Thermodesulfobacteriota bacterium]|nr:hypothetical protein [Thermodesulfobacteriota bacterium]